MFPTMKDGDVVLVNRLGYLFRQPQKGDLIALKDPRDKKILVKRITKVIDKQFYVEGDNKSHSTDSREFGMIGKSDIVGKVIIL